MRVLVAHNYYRSATPSGENLAVDTVVDCLARQGAEVDLVAWRSDDVANVPAAEQLRIAGRMVHTRGRGELLDRVAAFRPDVVQLHNPVPRVPPGDVVAVRRQGVPVVHVIHNYRHSCLNGSHRLSGESCVSCAGSRWSRAAGVRHRCYRGSLAQSALLALSETVHHDVWRALDGYVAISEHVRSYLISEGFPADRITAVPDPVPPPASTAQTGGRDVLFAGRLVPEKGISLLLESWAALTDDDRAGRILHVAGAGPEEVAVAAAASTRDDVVFHGRLDPQDLARLGARCALSVVPSVWDEPFGLVAAEALAAGRGIVVTARGALPEIASDPACSWICSPDRDALAAALRQAMSRDPGPVAAAARRRWQDTFSPEVVGRAHHDQLASVVAGHRLAAGVGDDRE